MGRKVHPIGFRLKVNKTWEGRWYAEGQEYVDQLRQDIELRDMIREETQRAGVSRIEIEWQGKDHGSYRQTWHFDRAQR